MSDRARALRRYLGSRKNIAGMSGALVGVGLHVAGVLGDVWPVVAAGLYGVGALVGPSDPVPGPAREPSLTDVLRTETRALVDRVVAHGPALPDGALALVRRSVESVELVLDRLDDIADAEADRIAAPERLARAAEIVRVDLPACLDTYLGRSPSTPRERAGQQLLAQLAVLAAAADRLVDEVPDGSARRAEDLTEELRRRHDGS
jgi:hypothetical protein